MSSEGTFDRYVPMFYSTQCGYSGGVGRRESRRCCEFFYPAHLAIDGLITEARIDDDGSDDNPCWFQQQMTAVGQIRHDLHRREVLWRD